MNDEIQSTLRTINDSWLSRNMEELSRQLGFCFHSDMIIKEGNLMTMARGREACVRSYMDFIRETQVSHLQ